MLKHNLFRKIYLVVGMGLLAVVLSLQPVQVARAVNQITVNTLEDVVDPNDGQCSLREAIEAANNKVVSGTVGGECAAGSQTWDYIIFSITGTIVVSPTLGSLPPLSGETIEIEGFQWKWGR